MIVKQAAYAAISDHHRGNPATLGPIHAVLRGNGLDVRGRLLADVLAFDARIEAVLDFIQ